MRKSRTHRFREPTVTTSNAAVGLINPKVAGSNPAPAGIGPAVALAGLAIASAVGLVLLMRRRQGASSDQ